jgi:hypothetical protein
MRSWQPGLTLRIYSHQMRRRAIASRSVCGRSSNGEDLAPAGIRAKIAADATVEAAASDARTPNTSDLQAV